MHGHVLPLGCQHQNPLLTIQRRQVKVFCSPLIPHVIIKSTGKEGKPIFIFFLVSWTNFQMTTSSRDIFGTAHYERVSLSFNLTK